MKRYLAFFIGFHLLFTAVTAQQKHSVTKGKDPMRGTASFYGIKFQGKQMANGEKFDQDKLTAAHNRLPLGTWVKVSNLRNRKSVIVQITDRMHPKNKRLIDVSRAAAKKLGFVKRGLTKVKLEIVDKPSAE